MDKVEDLNLNTVSCIFTLTYRLAILMGAIQKGCMRRIRLVLVSRHFVTGVNQGGRTDKAEKC